MLQIDEVEQKRIGGTQAVRRAKSPRGPRSINSKGGGGYGGGGVACGEITQIDIPKGSIFEKLTDPKEYTGHHKHRFDAETGQGLGLDGRDRNVKGVGTEPVVPVTANGDTLDIVHLMRPNLHNALTTSSPSSPRGSAAGHKQSPTQQITDRPATARARLEGSGSSRTGSSSSSGRTAKARRAKSPRAKSPGLRSARGERSDQTPEVFNRLADPARFTGHHKHRFDEENRGRGLAGRDSVVKGGGTTIDPRAQVLGLREQRTESADDMGAAVSPSHGQTMTFSPRAIAAEERERQTALLMSDIGASPRLSDAGSGMGSPRSPGTSSPRQRLVREV
jgi:hypothetical protein